MGLFPHGSFLIGAHNEMDNQFTLKEIDTMSLERVKHWISWENSVGGLSKEKHKRLWERCRELGFDPEKVKW